MLEFKVLGSLEVLIGGRAIPLGAYKQRLLLAVLLCHPGQVVSTGRLIDALWGKSPPASAGDNLRVYIHRLRRALGAQRISGRGRPGYAVVVQSDELDAARFVLLVRAGQQALAARENHVARQRAQEAVDLWRGSPFADLDGERALFDEAARLQHHLLTVIECRAEADLRLGNNAFVVAELCSLADRYPFHEGFRLQLMTALHRCGRRAEALETYARTRRLFADELGTEPGAQLRELHLALLRGDPEPAQAGLAQAGPAQPRLTPIPAQLPADAAIVVGRRSQLATLDKIHTEAAKRLVVLHGCGGVGKTTLAVHWAHGVAHEFPDGQLYLDLRGYGNERPLPPAEALSFFVRALGAAADQVPVTERELGALYRSLLATRRMLVILDNAGTAQAVRPLLPGSASCMVIVTSRGPLLGLQALDDACAVPVGPLSSAESVKLLARMTDANGTGLGRGQLREMATLSAHMPLALRIAAANCAGRTREQAAEFLLAMRADRFGRLRIDGEATSVRAAFETSYATLPPATQDLFRLVGSAPVRDISLPAAAALLARPSTEAAPGLAQLVHVGLADQRPGDRFRMHDLLRCYALELTGDRHDEEAMRRLLSFYHHTTIAAVAAAVQGVTRLEHDAAHPDVQPLSFDDAQSAATWLRTELTNLVAACGAAADCPPYRIAWQLADALRDYFWIHRCGPQWLAVADKALLASRNAGDVPAQAACHNNLGVADWCFARYDEATAHFRRAIELGRQSGDNQTVAAGLANLGGVYRETGDPDAGAASCGQALDLYERLTQTAGAANTRITLSGIGIDTGKFADAMAHAEHAIRQYRTLGRMDGQGSALLLISEAQCLTGRFELAMLAAREALTLFRALGTRQGEACALLAQASAHVAANQPDAAEPLAQAALAIGVDTGSPQLQAEASACLADVKLYRGAPLEAAQAYASAASLAQQIRLRVVEVKALTGQARALCNLHDFQAAEIHAARAARLAKDNGYLFHAANAVNVLRLAENRYSSV